MQDEDIDFGPSLKGLDKAVWIAGINAVVDRHGYLEPLGPRHLASFIERSGTLIVTFESIQGIQALSQDAQPLGWDMVKGFDWSHLGMICDGDTWFRDPNIYAFFDRLVDDGFFDAFDQVLFYGAGPCGYAASAFSVVAPGARVLAVQPQATLTPDIAGWDTRFTEKRRTDFTSRYGYAPDMIEAAQQAYILYDPRETEDSIHASLFAGSNVMRLQMPFMGGALQTDLLEMDLLHDMLEMACDGSLDRAVFHASMRARRDYTPYLRRLLSRLEADERGLFVEALCRNVTRRMNAPRFARKLKVLQSS
jgi:hypothetical protein